MERSMKDQYTYRIRNWQQYNDSLIQRGSITVWFSDDAIESWLEASKESRGKGRPQIYSDNAILSALMIRLVFHLPLRALQGYLMSLMKLLNLDLPIPHYTRICRRAKSLGRHLKKLSRKLPTDLVFDSTGLKVYGEGEWKVRQHGKDKRRTWRKMHIAICPDTHEIILVSLTENNIADSDAMNTMCKHVPGSVTRVYGDGAYDKASCRRNLNHMGIEAVIPPRKNAALQKGVQESWRKARDESVVEIFGLGGDGDGRRLWKKLKRYHRRSIVETAMFRYKTLFGARLRSRKIFYQQAEVLAGCLAINKMNRLGMPRGRWISG
jgi:hypothetical protein